MPTVYQSTSDEECSDQECSDQVVNDTQTSICSSCGVFHSIDDDWVADCELCCGIDRCFKGSHFWHCFQDHLGTLNPTQAESVRNANDELRCKTHFLPCVSDIASGWTAEIRNFRSMVFVDPNPCDKCCQWWTSMVELTGFVYVPLPEGKDCVCCMLEPEVVDPTNRCECVRCQFYWHQQNSPDCVCETYCQPFLNE